MPPITTPPDEYDWGKRLYEWSKDNQVYVVSDDAPQVEPPHVASIPPGFDRLIGIAHDDLLYSATLLAPDGKALWYPADDSADRAHPLAISSVGIFGNTEPIRSFAVLPPHNGKVKEIAVSPDGKRLLWAIRCISEPFGWFSVAARKAGLRLSFLDTRRTVSVWTTDIVGRDPVCVGEEVYRQRFAPKDHSALDPIQPDPPTRFSWSPDGERIRYTFGQRGSKYNPGDDYEIAVEDSGANRR